MPGTKLRLAAVGDIHCGADLTRSLVPLFAAMNEAADVILLCGDLTQFGLSSEAEGVVQELKSAGVRKPVVAVLGNHDFEAGKQETIKEILLKAGVHVLDGHSIELEGVGFAGTKGFCGGFGSVALQAWGEGLIKDFVRGSMEEAMKLESALAKIEGKEKVVLLHYSPILSTVRDEPPQVHAFLGSSHLEPPIDRFAAAVVFHGHAHHGNLRGWTQGKTPVYNAAMPLLEKAHPGRPPFVLVEVDRARPEPEAAAWKSS
jgi:Icc-related predicted phosphoesterase